MEAKMRRARAIVAGACLVAAACDEDPARSMKIVPRPPAAVSSAAAHPAPVSPAPVGVAAVSPADARPAETPPRAAGPARAARAARSSGTSARPPGTGASSSSAKVEPATATNWRQPGCPPPPEASSGPSNFTAAGPCAFKHRGAVACEALEDDFLVTLSRKGAGGATLTVYINVEQYHGPGDYRDAQIFLGLQDKFNIYRWSSDTLNITVGSGEQSVTLPATSLEAEPLFTNCTGPITNFQCEGREFAVAFLKTREVVSGTLRCEPRK
jgi:hypothetical protein